MSRTASILALERMKHGPFAGAFDAIPYDHPAFVLWIFVTVALVAVFVVTAWLLMRHGEQLRGEQAPRPDKQRGFEVIRGERNP